MRLQAGELCPGLKEAGRRKGGGVGIVSWGGLLLEPFVYCAVLNPLANPVLIVRFCLLDYAPTRT